MPGPIVGILALQGAFAKHAEMLQQLGIEVREIRHPEQLAQCDALVIPGGESTTIMRLIDFAKLYEPLQTFASQNPVFGTCAGLILMSNEILKDTMVPFKWLDVAVERNAYGRQIESFISDVDLIISNRTQKFPATFIRAPRICQIGPDVQVLAKLKEEPVLVRQGGFLGSTFHPELSADPSIHRYFLKMISNWKPTC